MYEAFFGFEQQPFACTPNTRFWFLSDTHDVALRTLLYGIESRSGFLVLTGEVGSGKTTTIRALLNHLSDDVETSLILNPLLSTIDLIQSINKDFGLESEERNVQAQLQLLNSYLLEKDRDGKNAVVIIDEAQNLSFEALEMARMLSNLETESHKLLTVVLVGQPELEARLQEKQLRQLAQRIQIHSKIVPLSLEQTKDYIRHHLSCSGEKVAAHFDDKAIQRIYKKTRGIPRLINNLCRMSLMAAFTQNTHTVDKKIITRALREVPPYVYYN